ncbi:MAG TPA: hypothetical protein VHK27_07110 [Gammaproteobacteria bacterium]|nr:hypothetical protein [Gammaproteobacteria bacterium]
MNEEARKQAAMKALQQMRSELDRLPEPDRNKVMEFVAELREKAKSPLFEAAMKIAVVETQIGEKL